MSGSNNGLLMDPLGGSSSVKKINIKCQLGTLSKMELEFGNVGFLRRGENWSIRRKTSWNREENQQQT